MKYKELFTKYVYFLFCTVMFNFMAISILTKELKFEINVILLFAIALITALIITAIYNLRKKLYFYISVLTVAIIIAVIIVWCDISVIPFFVDIVNWLNDFLAEKSDFILLPAFLIVFAFSLVVSILSFALSRKFITRLIVSALLVVGLIVMGFYEYNAPKSYIFGMISYSFLGITEIIHNLYYKPENKNDSLKPSSFLIPVAIIMAFSVAILPTNEKPIQWTFVKESIKKVDSLVKSITSELKISFGNFNGDYFIRMSGYSDDGTADGANLINSDKRAFTYTTYTPPAGALYLTGSIMDTYEDNHWSKEAYYPRNSDEYLMDLDEFLYALNRTDYVNNKSKIIRSRNITFYYDGLNTKTLFYPLKTMDVKADQKYHSDGTSIFFNKMQGYPASYKISYYELNLNSDYFLDFISSQQGYQYEKGNRSSNSMRGTVYRILNDENPEEPLAKRSKMIYEDYTGLPDNISDRVKNLAYEITDGVDGNYQKLRAIEKYLNENYTYTTTPGLVPEGDELCDYFLFESKQGYCTYFATSMAVLGRCVGIPTRYVQGFSCNNQRIDRDVYEVKNESAHAWVEGYIQGVGWIAFEPTASYGEARYPKWSWEKSSTNTTPNSYGSEYQRDYVFTDDDDALLREREQREATITIIVFSSILGVMIVTYLVFFINKKLIQRKYEKMDDTKKLVYDFKFTLKLFEAMGIKLIGGETLSQFSKRATHICSDEEVTFNRVSSYYMDVMYGMKTVGKFQSNYVNKYRHLVEKEVLVIKGKYKFFALKVKTVLSLQK